MLKPGAWSSQRHWHEGEDELVVMLDGEAVLVDDTGETVLRSGDVAAFAKNNGNGHVLQNRSDRPCVFVAIGRPSDTACHYPDIDMHLFAGAGDFVRPGHIFPLIARDGVTIYVASYQLLVEDACAGLNSLVSLSATLLASSRSG